MRCETASEECERLQPAAHRMNDRGIAKARTESYVLVGLASLAMYFCYLLVAPFLRPILSAIVLAILFYPVYAGIRGRLRKRNLAALLSTLLVFVIVVLACFLLAQVLASGLRGIYDSLRSAGNGNERLSLYLSDLLDKALAIAGRYLPVSTNDLRNATMRHVEQTVVLLLSMTVGALGSFTRLAVNALIAFFILFFLFRDGRDTLRRLVVLLPLEHGRVRQLILRVKETLHAVVYGSLSIAALQGALTGVGFWLLGVASPGLWAVVTALCALLPVVGTTLILLPAISMLIFTGRWIKGVILVVWGMAIVHPIDNLLRPFLISRRTELSTVYVFFALVGGLRAFGPVGVFVGPTILAAALALLQFLREEKRIAKRNSRWDLLVSDVKTQSTGQTGELVDRL